MGGRYAGVILAVWKGVFSLDQTLFKMKRFLHILLLGIVVLTVTGASDRMNTCRVQIYFDDGTVLSECKIYAYWTKGGFFSTEYEGKFYTDRKGWVTITWPADEADEIKDIYFSTGILFGSQYQLTNLGLKDGNTYRLNADSFK